jgi:hypothetical protein
VTPACRTAPKFDQLPKPLAPRSICRFFILNLETGTEEKSKIKSHPGAPDVINLARLYCYQNGVFWLVDVPKNKKDKKQLELSREGWVITHVEIV